MRLDELQNEPFFYHDVLNPILWANDQLKAEVRYKLLLISQNFINFLRTPITVKDILLSGSNATYSYNQYSDIDLHILIDFPKNKPELIELLDSKKNQYNATYNIKIKNINVELYVQDLKEPHYASGIYSIMHNKWIKKPKHQPPNVSTKEIINKSKSYSNQIIVALKSNDLSIARETMSNLKNLRRAGLEQGGEHSLENLTFKLLRNRGQIDKLRKYINKLQSDELSLGERNES